MTDRTIAYVGQPPTDRCICSRSFCALDPRDHETRCIGRHPAGWRARMPAFLLPEVDRILAGEPRDTPIYRDMTIEHAVIARLGIDIGIDDLAKLASAKEGLADG